MATSMVTLGLERQPVLPSVELTKLAHGLVAHPRIRSAPSVTRNATASRRLASQTVARVSVVATTPASPAASTRAGRDRGTNRCTEFIAATCQGSKTCTSRITRYAKSGDGVKWGSFSSEPTSSLLGLEFCAAGHTLLDVSGEGCHAKTLLAVNEEVEFLRGQMTVIHDCLRWVVRAGSGCGFQ